MKKLIVTILFFPILIVVLIISCTKRLSTDINSQYYVPYLEVFNINEAEITHSGLRTVIKGFTKNLVLFQKGVNSYSPYQLNYFVLGEGFCRNDSSFLILKAVAGNYIFYEHSNELDERMVERFRVVKMDSRFVLLAKDIEPSLCTEKTESVFKENMNIAEIEVGWYKKKNGDRLIHIYPYFTQICHIKGERIECEDLVFPKLIHEVSSTLH